MAAPAPCAPGCAPPLRGCSSALELELKVDLRLCSLCWMCGNVLEAWAQQLRQVGVTAADRDCWTKSWTRWHASRPRLVLGSRAVTRCRQAL